MTDREKVIGGLKQMLIHYNEMIKLDGDAKNHVLLYHKAMVEDALALLKEQEKKIKALRLLVEWATDCDFGFDQFHDEYERYKDEIKDMKYIDGMIHVAKRTLEDHGAFEEGR